MDSKERAPWIWVAALALVLTATRLAMSDAVSWDQDEQLVWSQSLALGYGPQPPLYTWLQWAVNLVLGPTTLAVVLVKNTLIALSFAWMLLAARQVLPARSAWLAAAGLAWLPGIAWQLLRDQTHTMMLTCAVAATWWLVLRQLRAPRPMGFVWIGLVAAWGMLSKYSYLLVVLGLLVAALSLPATRRALLSRGWWLAPVLGVLLVAPHAWWVLHDWQDASAATLVKLRPEETPSYLHGLATGFGDLLAFLLLAVLPWALMSWAAFGRYWKAASAPAQYAVPDWLLPLLWRYVAVVVATFVLMVLAGASKFDGRWIQPLLLIVPLWALARWPQLGSDPRGVRRYLTACVALLVLVWAAALYAPLRDARQGNGDRLNWQLGAIEASLRQAGFQGEGVVLTEHHATGGVLRMLFPRAHIVVCDELLATAPQCVTRTLAQARAQHRTALQITSDDPAPDAWWQGATPDGSLPQTHIIALPYRWTDPAQAQLYLEYLLYPAR